MPISSLRGNELIQSLIAGPMVFINDPSRARPKVIEPLKVAQDIMQVIHISRDQVAVWFLPPTAGTNSCKYYGVP